MFGAFSSCIYAEMWEFVPEICIVGPFARVHYASQVGAQAPALFRSWKLIPFAVRQRIPKTKIHADPFHRGGSGLPVGDGGGWSSDDRQFLGGAKLGPLARTELRLGGCRRERSE